MKRFPIMLIASALAISGTAYAGGKKGGGGDSKPPVTTSSPTYNNHNNSNAVGVGVGMGVGVGHGGKATANNHNNIKNNVDSHSHSHATGGSVKNSGNFYGTVKGGAGGNASIESGAVKNSNDMDQNQRQNQNQVATGISGGSFGGNGGSSYQTQSNDANNSNSNSNEASGNHTAVTVEGDTYKAARIPVSTAYAASLTSGLDTCLGSASGGAQLPMFGFSIGSTKVDNNCVLIKQTQLLRSFGPGFDSAACYRMTQGKEGKPIKKALESAGIDCAQVGSIVAAADVAGQAPVVAAPPVVIFQEVPEKKLSE